MGTSPQDPGNRSQQTAELSPLTEGTLFQAQVQVPIGRGHLQGAQKLVFDPPWWRRETTGLFGQVEAEGAPKRMHAPRRQKHRQSPWWNKAEAPASLAAR